jgi:hypothetical protein
MLRAVVVRCWLDPVTPIRSALEAAGFAVTLEQLDTEVALWAALDRGGWQVVIADRTTPQLDAVAVRAIAAAHPSPVPVVELDRLDDLAAAVRRVL